MVNSLTTSPSSLPSFTVTIEIIALINLALPSRGRVYACYGAISVLFTREVAYAYVVIFRWEVQCLRLR